MNIKPRKAVESLPVYQPAKSIESTRKEFGFDRVIKLAGNENTLGFSDTVRTALKAVTSYYPDGSALALKEKLSEKLKVGEDQLIIGNGSFELLSLIGLTFLETGDEAIAAKPSFGWYTNVTLTMGAKLVDVGLTEFKVDLDRILEKVNSKTKVIWLCNPNNPTGTIFTHDELTAFLSQLRSDIVVVMDEAYYDFVAEEGYPDSISLLKAYPNIIILRTFSKLEGLANLRVGYAVADEQVIGYLNRVRSPINVNGAAQLAAAAAMDDENFKQKTLSNVQSGLEKYYQVLTEWGCNFIRSNTNFILFDIGIESQPVADQLVRHGILIRSGAEFGYPTMLRVSIGTPEENERVIALLGELIKEKRKEEEK